MVLGRTSEGRQNLCTHVCTHVCTRKLPTGSVGQRARVWDEGKSVGDRGQESRMGREGRQGRRRESNARGKESLTQRRGREGEEGAERGRGRTSEDAHVTAHKPKP